MQPARSWSWSPFIQSLRGDRRRRETCSRDTKSVGHVSIYRRSPYDLDQKVERSSSCETGGATWPHGEGCGGGAPDHHLHWGHQPAVADPAGCSSYGARHATFKDKAPHKRSTQTTPLELESYLSPWQVPGHSRARMQHKHKQARHEQAGYLREEAAVAAFRFAP
jgi:hypothetical protein